MRAIGAVAILMGGPCLHIGLSLWLAGILLASPVVAARLARGVA